MRVKIYLRFLFMSIIGTGLDGKIRLVRENFRNGKVHMHHDWTLILFTHHK